jgi:hypothetical protein
MRNTVSRPLVLAGTIVLLLSAFELAHADTLERQCIGEVLVKFKQPLKKLEVSDTKHSLRGTTVFIESGFSQKSYRCEYGDQSALVSVEEVGPNTLRW